MTTWGTQPAQSSQSSQQPQQSTSDADKPDSEDKINNLVAMGYPRSEVVSALRAAMGDPNAAVEYLTNGIPDDIAQLTGVGADSGSASQTPAGSPTPSDISAPAADDAEVDPALYDQMTPEQLRALGRGQAAAPLPSLSGSGAAGSGGASANQPLPPQVQAFVDSLFRNPQFAQLRPQLANNPGLAGAILTQLTAANPQFAAVIGPYRQAIIQRLTGSAGGSGGGVATPTHGTAHLPADLFNGRLPQLYSQLHISPDGPMMSGMTSSGGPDIVPDPSGGVQVRVSPEDMRNIQQIMDITGVDQSSAVQAYFAMDKNVQNAISFLMDSA